MNLLTSFGLAFVPLFVAIDPVGLVPIFVGMTTGLESDRVRRIVHQAALVSFAIAVGFAFTGRWIFNLLSIQVQDFQIAGGLLLFGYAITDILASGRRTRRDTHSIGIVPLATPLIAGPALLTTLMLMIQDHGMSPTLLALAANLLLAWIGLLAAEWLVARVGRELLAGASKVIMILLAAIGVMMVRQGMTYYLNEFVFSVAPRTALLW